MQPHLVLIHSPLVGPLTWLLVASELQRRQVETIVPALDDDPKDRVPFWEQHVESVKRALDAIPHATEIVLIGHSGAGPLLPAIGRAANHPIASYIFVDAGIPVDGLSRLELMAHEDPDFARSLVQHLADGTFPEWSEDDLASIVPNPQVRRELVADLRPRGLDFFSEPIPVFADWPDAPCGYLQFSSAYDEPARRAREAGWSFKNVDAGHFSMLTDPSAIADELLAMIQSTNSRRTATPSF
jgi:pimeloyl-ACP methyl ester carboxylesterase